MKRYVLLLRHGAVDRDPKKIDEKQPLKKGADDILLVAGILAGHLNLLPDEDAILIGEIWSGSYQHIKQSAEIVFDTLKNKVQKFKIQGGKEYKTLDPDVFRLIKDKEDRQKVGQWLLDKSKDENLSQDKPANAILVVGHAPQIKLDS